MSETTKFLFTRETILLLSDEDGHDNDDDTPSSLNKYFDFILA